MSSCTVIIRVCTYIHTYVHAYICRHVCTYVRTWHVLMHVSNPDPVCHPPLWPTNSDWLRHQRSPPPCVSVRYACVCVCLRHDGGTRLRRVLTCTVFGFTLLECTYLVYAQTNLSPPAVFELDWQCQVRTAVMALGGRYYMVPRIEFVRVINFNI